jgi:hypothetical protein
MRKALALVALSIAGFAFGFAGCGEDDDSGPAGRTDTAPVTTDTGVETAIGDTDTLDVTTGDTTTTGEDGDGDDDFDY